MKAYTKYWTIAIIAFLFVGCTSKEQKDKVLDVATNGTELSKLSFLYFIGDDPESLARMLNIKEIKESDLNNIAKNYPQKINVLFQYYADNYHYSDKASYIRTRSEYDPEWFFFSSIRYLRYLSPIVFWIIEILLDIAIGLIILKFLND